MIDFEFKDVLTNSSNNVDSFQKVAARIKEVQIYDNYNSQYVLPIGKGSYTVIGKEIKLSKKQKTGTIAYVPNKIEQSYHSKNVTQTGSIINKLF